MTSLLPPPFHPTQVTQRVHSTVLLTLQYSKGKAQHHYLLYKHFITDTEWNPFQMYDLLFWTHNGTSTDECFDGEGGNGVPESVLFANDTEVEV